jgi:hypothetical protein
VNLRDTDLTAKTKSRSLDPDDNQLSMSLADLPPLLRELLAATGATMEELDTYYIIPPERGEHVGNTWGLTNLLHDV